MGINNEKKMLNVVCLKVTSAIEDINRGWAVEQGGRVDCND